VSLRVIINVGNLRVAKQTRALAPRDAHVRKVSRLLGVEPHDVRPYFESGGRVEHSALVAAAADDHGVTLALEVVADGGRHGVVPTAARDVVVDVDAEACCRAAAVEPLARFQVLDAEDDDELVEAVSVVVITFQDARVLCVPVDARLLADDGVTEHDAREVVEYHAVDARDLLELREGHGIALDALLQEADVAFVEAAPDRIE
jgi:hypothetical protein